MDPSHFNLCWSKLSLEVPLPFGGIECLTNKTNGRIVASTAETRYDLFTLLHIQQKNNSDFSEHCGTLNMESKIKEQTLEIEF